LKKTVKEVLPVGIKAVIAVYSFTNSVGSGNYFGAKYSLLCKEICRNYNRKQHGNVNTLHDIRIRFQGEY